MPGAKVKCINLLPSSCTTHEMALPGRSRETRVTRRLRSREEVCPSLRWTVPHWRARWVQSMGVMEHGGMRKGVGEWLGAAAEANATRPPNVPFASALATPPRRAIHPTPRPCANTRSHGMHAGAAGPVPGRGGAGCVWPHRGLQLLLGLGQRQAGGPRGGSAVTSSVRAVTEVCVCIHAHALHGWLEAAHATFVWFGAPDVTRSRGTMKQAGCNTCGLKRILQQGSRGLRPTGTCCSSRHCNGLTLKPRRHGLEQMAQ